jgi:hypothetical protein
MSTQFKHMKELLISVLIAVQGFLGLGGEKAPSLGATPVLNVSQGGTGWGNIQSGTYLTGNGTGKLSTSTCADITGSADLCDGVDATGSGAAFPFTVQTGYNSTSTVIGFNGLFSTASSTFSSSLFLPSLSQGFLYTGTNGKVNTIASSSIQLSWFNNDAGFLTSLAGAASSTLLSDANTWTGSNTIAASLFNLTGLSDGCAQIASGLITSTGANCGAGASGGSGGTWSTTTSSVASRFINYPNNNTDIVTIGNTATTSAKYWFDPNTLNALIGNSTSASTTIMGNATTTGTFTAATSLKVGTNYVATSTVVCKSAGNCDYTTVQAPLTDGWRPIDVKQGTFSEQLTIQNTKTNLKGQSLLSILQANGVTQSPAITTNTKDETTIQGLTINETNASLNGTGVDLSNSSLNRLLFNRINNFATSTLISDSANNSFYNLIMGNTFFGSRTGIELSGTLANANNSAFNRIRPMQSGVTGNGIGLYNARGFNSFGDNIEGTTTSNNSIAVFSNATARDNNIYGPWIEANTVGIGCEVGFTRLGIFGGTVTGNGTDIDTDCIGNMTALNVNVTGRTLNMVGERLGVGTTTSILQTATPVYEFGVEGDSILHGNLFVDGFGATSTSLGITGLATPAGAFLAVDPNGSVIATTTPSGSSFAWPFTAQTWGVSTSTTLGLLNGFLSTASSTIVGNATTTGIFGVGQLNINNFTVATSTVVCRSPEVCQYVTDGVADDVQINMALRAVGSSTSPGIVHIKAATYNITSPLLIGTNVTLEGEGNATILKAGTNLNDAVVRSNGRVHDAVVRDIYIDGNSANQSTSGTGIEFNGYYNHFRNVWVIDAKTLGIYLNASTGSSENRIIGGRYNAGTNAIKISADNNDFYVEQVTAYGGTDTILNSGGGGRFNNIMVFNGSASGLKTDIQTACFDCRISVTPIGFYIDSSAQNNIGLWEGTQIYNPVFSEITDHSIYENVGTGFSSYLNVEGWNGQNSTNADISLDGDGTHRTKVSSVHTMLDVEKLSTGTIHNDTYITQPQYATSTAPTFPVAGMIYLDSGTNTTGGIVGQRRYNGSSWIDVGGNFWANATGGISYLSKVGVGTTSLSNQLSVDAGVASTLGIFNTNLNTSNPALALNNWSSNANAGSRLSFQWSGTERAAIISQLGSGVTPSLQFNTASAERMRLTSTGLLGIGTTTPTHKLTLTDATAPQLSLSAGAGINQWVFRNEGGYLAIATSTHAATSSVSALRIDPNGKVIANCFSNDGSTCITSGAAGTGSSKWATTTDSTTTITPAGATQARIGTTTGQYKNSVLTIAATSTDASYSYPLAILNSSGTRVFSVAEDGWTDIVDASFPMLNLSETDTSTNGGLYNEATHLHLFAGGYLNAGTSRIVFDNGITLTGMNIKGALIPDADDAYAIGSNAKPWSGLWLGPDECINFGSASDGKCLIAESVSDSGGKGRTLLLQPASNGGSGWVVISDGTPNFALDISTSTTAQLSLNDGVGLQYGFRVVGDNFYISTSTNNSSATSTLPLFRLDANGNAYIKDLVSCDTIDTDANGMLSCGTDATGAGGSFPFTVNTGYNSTSTVIGFNGLFSTASSTFSSSLLLPSLAQGFLYTGSNGLVQTMASSSIKTSWLTNDSGFTNFAWPFTAVSAGVVSTTSQINLAGFLSTASSTIVGNATTTGTHGAGAIYVNSDYITDFTGTGLSVTNGVLSASGSGASSTLLGDYNTFTNTNNFTTKLGVATSAPAGVFGVTGTSYFRGDTYVDQSNLVLNGAASAILGTSDVDIYANNQLTRGFNIFDNGTNIEISALGSTQLDINDSIKVTGTGWFTNGILATASSTILGDFKILNGNLMIGTSTPWLNSRTNIVGTTTVQGQLVSLAASTTAAATQTINWSSGNTQKIMLTTNTSIVMNATSSNPIDGGKYTLRVCQDPTGSRTLTWANPTPLRWWNGTTTISSAANKCTYIGMIYTSENGNSIYSVVASSTGLDIK